MASIERNPNTVLIKRVVDNARNIDFTQLAKLLDAFDTPQQNNEEDGNALGEVVYRANPSMGFPSSDVDSITLSPFGHYEVIVNFMGLFGPASPLPAYFTEAVISECVAQESEDSEIFFVQTKAQLKSLQDHQLDIETITRNSFEIKKSIKAGVVNSQLVTTDQLQALLDKVDIEDVFAESLLEDLKTGKLVFEIHTPARTNQRDFLDLFNHKFIQMYLQASLKYKPYVFWRAESQEKYVGMLYALIGAPLKEERENTHIKWERLLSSVGLIGVNRGSPEIIQKVISRYFNFELSKTFVEEGILRRAVIPQEQTFLLGQQANILAEETCLGSFINDSAHKFRFHITNLTAKEYLSFCPYNDTSDEKRTNSNYLELMSLLSYLSAANQLFDGCLHLMEKESIPFVLSSTSGNCLGFSTWLGERQDFASTTIIQ